MSYRSFHTLQPAIRQCMNSGHWLGIVLYIAVIISIAQIGCHRHIWCEVGKEKRYSMGYILLKVQRTTVGGNNVNKDSLGCIHAGCWQPNRLHWKQTGYCSQLMKSELISAVIDHRMLMGAHSSRKYYCHIQTRAKYCPPSPPTQKEGVLQSYSGDSRRQVKRALRLTQNVRSINIWCASKCSS